MKCVQYRGGYHEYRGGYLEYRGGVQYHGGYHEYHGGYHEYHGVILSTVGDVQYHGGYHDARGGYHEYRGGCSVSWGESLLLFEYPTVLNTPHGTDDIPHGTQISKDGIPPRY